MAIFSPTGIQYFDANLRGVVLCTLSENGYSPAAGFQIMGSGGYFGSNGQTPVAVSSDGEILITETERERNVYAAFSKTGISNTVWGCVIDKSAIGIWPHNYTGRIDVSYLSLQVDRVTGTQGSFSVGVITRTGAANGDVLFFGGLNFSNSTTETHLERQENFSPSQLKLGVNISGLTPFMVGTKTTGIAELAVTGRLDSFLGTGTVQPSPGDVICRFERTTGVYNASTRLLYHTEKYAP